MDDQQHTDGRHGDGVRRRDFVRWSAMAAGGVAVSSMVGSAEASQQQRLEPISPDAVVPLVPDYTVVLRRESDQCLLTFALYNMKPDFSTSPVVFTKVNPDRSNTMVVAFGSPAGYAPQHVAEQAFPLKAPNLAGSAQVKPVPNTAPVSAPAVKATIAGPSKLAFAVPDILLGHDVDRPMLLDAAHLLDWTGLALNVPPNAVPPFVLSERGAGAPPGVGTTITTPVRPNQLQTAIEMPTGVVISPPVTPTFPANRGERTIFVNATAPVTHNGWTELWHTRLAARRFIAHGDLGEYEIDEVSPEYRTVRAVWAQDAPFAHDTFLNTSGPGDSQLLGFRSALTYNDRYDIVRLSSDFSGSSTTGGPYRRPGTGLGLPGFVPSPAQVELLMLTSLGGWLDSDAHWDLPHGNNAVGAAHPSNGKPYYNSSLLSWRHRSTQARDSYVRVVRKGYLYPFGHKASLITVTERELTQVGGTTGAYLRQKTFIVVSAPLKSYLDPFMPNDGRGLPFRSVRALTLVTPDINAPLAYTTDQKHNPELAFQPVIVNKPFLFHFSGVDWAGDQIDFRSPVLWVDDTVAYGDQNPTLISDLLMKWTGAADLHGQRISVAASKNPAKAKGDTQVVATSIVFSGVAPTPGTTAAQLIGASQPAFYPAMHSITVDHPEARTASGNTIGGSVLRFEPKFYVANGFVGNPGGIFLSRVPAAAASVIKFNSAKSGGAITPNLGIDGISREIGPASGNTDDLALGNFDPKSVFDKVDAKLMGGLELSTILAAVHFGDDSDNTKVLQLTSVEETSPHRIVTTLDWHPTIVSGGPTIGPITYTIFEVQGADRSDDSMDLHAVIVTDLDNPAHSTTEVYGQIRNFNIDLFGKDSALYFIQIPFDSLTFRAHTGKKTDVDVQIGSAGVQFLGALEFVQDLADALQFAGSGLVIDTSGEAITATLHLAIPTLTVGVFSLAHLAFNAGVAIPYNGDPVRFEFSFCTRQDPFQLTIMIFTGGGFVGIGIGADGVELLEFSFDFGMGISIDIGIASGQVSLVGGVYYESKKIGDGTQDVELTAFVKASGGISALGLISLSVELYLSLTYESHEGSSKLSGDADLSISVHILFFGFSVGFRVHKEFAGSSPTPAAHAHAQRRALDAGATFPTNTFGAALSSDDWAEYCTSFALVGLGV